MYWKTYFCTGIYIVVLENIFLYWNIYCCTGTYVVELEYILLYWNLYFCVALVGHRTKGFCAVVLVDRFWLSRRVPWWYTVYQVQAVQHLKEEDLQHRILTLQLLALRKRRTSREDMPNGFRCLAAQSAHDLNLRPRSCLLAVINSCREQLLVKLVHASNDIRRTCLPLA